MGELQFALIGAGVSVLLGVIIYNAWQRIKVRRALPRSLSTELQQSSGQIQSAPAEPTLLKPTSADPETQLESINTQPSQAEEPTVNLSPAAHPKSDLTSIIDPRIDCIVPLRFTTPIAAEKLIPLAQRLRRAGNKPILIAGEPSSNTAIWQNLQAGERYQALHIAVQLANRSGPLNELEFSEFIAGMQILADTLDAELDCPDMHTTVASARELDAFAAQCDVQLLINVTSDSAPWSAHYVQAIAAQDGLLLSRDGTRFIKLDAKQNPVFVLQFNNTNFLRDDLTYKGGRSITFLLDVPTVGEENVPFRLMYNYATSLSQRIGAHLTDDRQNPLPITALAAIEQQLMTLYTKLEEASIPAGSPLARRLFI
ncbi:cell division protein ZipA C-terminal FtsZ-binding domain-containing protein [Mycoavidus sp. B2-EB]|uniref:cell division protein ZipA C-terminal FtsZ-binding domain-containing protein n=1 Tax=Mycoavidus sp. B2-EB TaxID=2651972 RepID=UPI00162A9E49|nr:cell division protein ZipA C-terminal FtsZ-binding domain-containing protein [Mycoavidus sp. B2-EB]BBO59779.1 cell division protein ZipA [Mycoavidus sp. B2-EB]